MDTYILKCVECGNELEEESMSDICEECDGKEFKKTNIAKRTRIFKGKEGNKTNHRTKKRNTCARKIKEVPISDKN